jgi:hypothetical protein
VRERGDYAANFQEISDLMLKLLELKVTQSEQVGASLLPRLELSEPDKIGDGDVTQPQKADGAAAPKATGDAVKPQSSGDGAKPQNSADAAKPQSSADAAKPRRGEGTGILIEFQDAQNKNLARLVLGKIVKKKDPLNPLPNAVDGVPAGRYVLPATAKDIVVVVSDPLSKADANPGKWLSKDFFKADRIKTLTVGPEGGAPSWKIARSEEWGQWKFAAGAGDLAAGRAVAAVNALGQMTFADVAVNAKPEDAGKPVVVTAETFDNLTYTVRIAKQQSGEDYLVNVTVAGEPRKPACRTRTRKRRNPSRRNAATKTLPRTSSGSRSGSRASGCFRSGPTSWRRKDVEPLMMERSDLVAKKDAKGEKGLPPGFPGMPGMPPGMMPMR